MRFFQMNRKNWIPGVSDGLTLPCAVCGRKNIKFDCIVKDSFWKEVVPKEIRQDVVCLPCLDRMAKEKGLDLGSNVVSLQFTGTGFTIEFFPVNVFRYKREAE